MLKEKEKQLGQYYLLTKAMISSLTKGAADEFFDLLEQREALINSMNQLDDEAGVILLNEDMKRQLKDIEALEKRIQVLLGQLLKKLDQKVRFAQNETFLTKQYEDTASVSVGIFYDKKK